MRKAEDLSKSGNRAVARALGVLDILAESPPMGVREIARKIDVSPSIALRLVNTLLQSGYLEQTRETARYTIGYNAFRVGSAFIGNNTVHSAVMPELYAIAEQQINGFLGVLRDQSIIYLAAVKSSGPITLNFRPGAQTSIHSTALGKAILAELPEDGALKLLKASHLPRLTPRTKVYIPKLLAELSKVRKLGYAVNDEENRIGVYSAGAVVRDADNRAIGAISGALPSTGLTDRDRAKVIRLVVDAARRASQRLGAVLIERRSRKAKKSLP